MVLINCEQTPDATNDTNMEYEPMKAVFDLIGEIEELSSILGVLMEWEKASPMSRKLARDRIESSAERIEDVAYKLKGNRIH